MMKLMLPWTTLFAILTIIIPANSDNSIRAMCKRDASRSFSMIPFSKCSFGHSSGESNSTNATVPVETATQITIDTEISLADLKFILSSAPRLTILRLKNTKLKGLAKKMFRDSSRKLKRIQIETSSFKTLKWQWFARNAKEYILVVNSGSIDCDCSVHWMFEDRLYRERTVPFIDDGTDITIKPVDLLGLPIRGLLKRNYIHCSANQIERQSVSGCQKPTVSARIMEGISGNAGKYTVECTFTPQIPHGELDPDTVRFLTRHPSKTRSKSHITRYACSDGKSTCLNITLENVSYEDLGWIVCEAWHTESPAFDMKGIAKYLPPKFLLSTSIEQEGTFQKQISVGYHLVGYPLHPKYLKLVLMKNNKSIPVVKKAMGWTAEEHLKHIHIRVLRRNLTSLILELDFIIEHYRPEMVQGSYYLEVCNKYGCSSKHHIVEPSWTIPTVPPIPRISEKPDAPPNVGGLNSFVALCLGIGILAAILSVLFVRYLIHRRRRFNRKEDFVSSIRSTQLKSGTEEGMLLEDNKTYVSALMAKIPVIPSDELSIIREVGEGAFGKVFMAGWESNGVGYSAASGSSGLSRTLSQKSNDYVSTRKVAIKSSAAFLNKFKFC